MRAPLALLLALAACTTGDPVTDLTRAAARTVVQPAVQQVLPGPNSAAVTDCILNNATQAELLSLARDVTNEPGTTTVQTVLAIAQRPETLQCITTTGLIPALQ